MHKVNRKLLFYENCSANVLYLFKKKINTQNQFNYLKLKVTIIATDPTLFFLTDPRIATFFCFACQHWTNMEADSGMCLDGVLLNSLHRKEVYEERNELEK